MTTKEEFFQKWDEGADNEELGEILNTFIRSEYPDYNDHLDAIAYLKQEFKSDLPHRAVVEAIDEVTVRDCRRVRWRGENYGVIDMRKSSSNRKSIPPSKREEIHERDNNQCVRCGATDELEIHHVIPVSHGGLNHDHNLVTLCEPCNMDAHAGDYSSRRMVYDGLDGFWRDFVEGYDG